MKTYITDNFDLFLLTLTDEQEDLRVKKKGKGLWSMTNKMISKEHD